MPLEEEGQSEQEWIAPSQKPLTNRICHGGFPGFGASAGRRGGDKVCMVVACHAPWRQCDVCMRSVRDAGGGGFDCFWEGLVGPVPGLSRHCTLCARMTQSFIQGSCRFLDPQSCLEETVVGAFRVTAEFGVVEFDSGGRGLNFRRWGGGGG